MAVLLTLDLERSEYEELERMARDRGISVEGYVHRVITLARQKAAADRVTNPLNIQEKLEAVRAAVRHQFPTADIKDMLDEIDGKVR